MPLRDINLLVARSWRKSNYCSLRDSSSEREAFQQGENWKLTSAQFALVTMQSSRKSGNQPSSGSVVETRDFSLNEEFQFCFSRRSLSAECNKESSTKTSAGETRLQTLLLQRFRLIKLHIVLHVVTSCSVHYDEWKKVFQFQNYAKMLPNAAILVQHEADVGKQRYFWVEACQRFNATIQFNFQSFPALRF